MNEKGFKMTDRYGRPEMAQREKKVGFCSSVSEDFGFKGVFERYHWDEGHEGHRMFRKLRNEKNRVHPIFSI